MTKDLNLIEACRKGDPRAQLQFYKRYSRQMLNLSLKLVNNAEAANEIVTESFFVLFDNTNSFHVHSDIIILLRKVVEERSIEMWKRKNVHFPGMMMDRSLVK